MNREILLRSFEEIPYNKLWVLERISISKNIKKSYVTKKEIWRGSYDVVQVDDSFFWKGFDINVEDKFSFFQRRRSQVIEYNMSRLLEENLIKEDKLLYNGRFIEIYSLTEEGVKLLENTTDDSKVD
jgi:hypothetical protein